MSDPLFDDKARGHARRRALRRGDAPFLAVRIVDDLVASLVPIRRRFVLALVTGCPPGLRHRLGEIAEHVDFADSIDGLAGHAPESLDLLLIVGELDQRDSLPQLLAVARSRLRPGGFVCGAIAGGNSLPALRAVLHAADSTDGRHSARTHPRIEPGGLAALLSAAGFDEPVVEVDRLRLRYRSLGRLIADLRDHAATNSLAARDRTAISRSKLRDAERAFALMAEDGAVEERVELLHFAAWAGSDIAS